MKTKITGVILTILSVLMMIGPKFIFPVCQGLKDDGTFMKCHYTQQALLCVGLVMVVLSIGTLICKQNETRILAGIGLIAGSIMSMLIPTVLIGVCKTATMSCVALTKPAVIVVGILTILVAIVNIIFSLKKSE